MSPRLFLKHFRGYLQVDGYAGYDSVENVTLVGYWAHARRRFNDALSADARSKASVASEGLAFCNTLFAIERELKEAEPEQRRLVRLTRSAHRFWPSSSCGWTRRRSACCPGAPRERR